MAKHFYLIHRLYPNRYYHSGTKWTWRSLLWWDTPNITKLHYWSLAIGWLCVIPSTLTGGASYPSQRYSVRKLIGLGRKAWNITTVCKQIVIKTIIPMRINFYLLRTFCPHLGSFCVVSSFTTFRPNFTSGLLQVIYRGLLPVIYHDAADRGVGSLRFQLSIVRR